MFRSGPLLVALLVAAPSAADEPDEAPDDGSGVNLTLDFMDAGKQKRLEAKERSERAQEQLARIQAQWDQVEARRRYAQDMLQEFDRVHRPQQPQTGRLRITQMQRRQTEQRLLSYQGQMGGAIVSGRALNHILEMAGPYAFEQKLRASENLVSQASPDLERFHALKRQLAGKAARIDDDLMGRIGYLSGVSGHKRQGRFGAEGLDLTWPLVLRHERFEPTCRHIEGVHAKTVQRLRSGQPVTFEEAQELNRAILALSDDYAEAMADAVKGARGYGVALARWFTGKKFVEQLQASGVLMVQASGMADLQAAPFRGGTTEDLLAHMYESGLKFAPAAKEDEQAYQRLFRLMLPYYVNLLAAQRELVATEAELAVLTGERRQALDEVYEANRPEPAAVADSPWQGLMTDGGFGPEAAADAAIRGAARGVIDGILRDGILRDGDR